MSAAESKLVTDILAAAKELDDAPFNPPVEWGRHTADGVLFEVQKLRGEVDCRIEHGAASGGHLEYVRSELEKILQSGRES